MTTAELDACPMPHPRLPQAELSPEMAERAKASGLTTFFGQFGHKPGLIESWLGWYQPLMVTGVVPVRTKELCRLANARRTGCHMCRFGRFPDPATGQPAVTDDEADAVLSGNHGVFEPEVQAALAYVLAFWDDHKNIPDETVQAVVDGYGTDGFVELAFLIAQWLGMGKLFYVLGIPNEAPAG